jgi:hypothetical protein
VSTTYTITAGHDTSTVSTNPNLASPRDSALGLWNTFSGTTRYTYIYFPLPVGLPGTTVASASITGLAYGTTSATIRVRLITGSWSDATATYNHPPPVGSALVDTAITAATVGQAVTFDVSSLLQSVSSGQAWYGFRFEAVTAGTAFTFQSFESGYATPWVLTINTSDAPETPQSLVPNGTVVAQAKPVLSCDFTDNGGVSTDMGAIQVQIDPAQNAVTPAYDSTMVASTLPVFDLSSPPTGAPAYAGLGSGSTTYWRVRVQDTSGIPSGWSDWAGFTYRPQPTLTVLTPAAGVLWDPTSDIIASTSASMSAYRVQITDGSDRTLIRYDSGRQPANPSALTTVQVALPEKYHGTRVLVDDRNYQLHIRIWDAFTTRQATPGSPAYVESWSTFHFDDDLTQTPIATLTAQQTREAFPATKLTWTRASAPDGWLVFRDKTIIAKLLPADVISGVSTYTWTDQNPAPWVQHIYDVRPTTITGGVSKRGKAGPLASITPDVLGIHLHTDDGQHVVIDAGDTSQLTINDRLSTYKPLNLRYDVDILTANEGLSGPFTGGIIPSAVDTQSVQAAMAVLQSIKNNPTTPVRLIFGLFSGRVLLRNISVTPSALGNKAVPVQNVSFSVNQVEDF